MRIHTTPVLITASFFFIACTDNKPAPADPKENSIQQTEEHQPQPAVEDDSPSFATQDSLRKYYDEKLQSAYKQREIAVNNKNMQEINSIDSVIQNTCRLKHGSIIKMIVRDGHTEENFNLFRYLLGGYHQPYSFLDSIFMSFPQQYRDGNTGHLYRKLIDKQKSESLKSYKLSLLNHTFFTTTGEQTTLNETTSEYILIDLWASWCLPCRRKNIELVKLYEKLPKNSKVTIVAISLDVNEKKWKDAATADGLNLTSLLEPEGMESSFVKALQVQLIPQTFLIDKKGNILSTDHSIEGITKAIKAL